MTDYEMTEEKAKEYATCLEEGTLDAIRSGIPVSPEQAVAAIAYISLHPPKKPTFRQRVKRFLWGP